MAAALRLRRDLSLPLPAPHWPPGLAPSPFTEDSAAAAHAVMLAGYAPGEGSVPPFPTWWQSLVADSEFDPALFFLARADDGQLAGVCQCWTSAFVKDLVVASGFRGRGIGEALMLTAFHAFRTRGAKNVDLKVETGNAPALRLYRRLGMSEG
ncbi:GNAT family N-acetyltransferase [Hyphomonas sp. WL0036]|uniref:GNAT family N-acetyltransferase n=1 Tax=Hyphomonas sediminis TaxID=2866160 RepID=UPI001C8114E6|nr:GNAT family N-acetyltransferase [Hyphomonas sediminis]MBY9067023.1 GNAT family N-acetyltransferase [Hyphomonas sediminis]